MKYPYFILLVFLILLGCTHEQVAFNAKVWVGDSLHQALQRKQDNESISCSDPQFNQMFSISKESLICLEEILLSCEKWKKQPPCGLQKPKF